MFSDFRSDDLARLSKQRVGFWSSLEGCGLDAIRTIAHPLLCDEFKQDAALVVVQDKVAMMRQSDAYL